MFKWWDNIKKNIEDDVRLIEYAKQLKKENQEYFRKTIESIELKRRENRNKLISSLKAVSENNLIQLFKVYVRTDEFHAEEVAMFYECLTDNEKEIFLTNFTEEEKEVILFQYENLRNYTDDVIKETMEKIKRELETKNG